MEPSYWKKYDSVYKHFSYKKIYELILHLTKDFGAPFERKSSRGRPFKICPVKYAAFMIFEIITGDSQYRSMELDSELFVAKHIDHSTFSLNYGKIPLQYFLKLIARVGVMLEHLLRYTKEYVVDSTTVTTPLTFTTIIKGKKVKEKIEYRSHAIVSIHEKEQAVVVRTALSTSKKIADCEAAKIMLEEGTIQDINLNADRGYDFERVYKACYENNIKPNIRPREYLLQEETQRLQGITEYNDEKRRKYRGRIEVIFGGITNAKLMTTRLKKETKILSYTALILLRHNILTLARTLAS